MGRTHELYRRLVANTARRRTYRTTARDTMTTTTNAATTAPCWATYTTVSGSELRCTEPAGHEGDHYAGGPWPGCRTCELLPAGRRMPARRRIGGVWYCFAHGMDIYCD
jgi:hypothetical protein